MALGVSMLVAGCATGRSVTSAPPPTAGDRPAALAPLAALRVPFVGNRGQVDLRVGYYARTFAGTLFVTRDGQLVYSLPARVAARERRSPRSAGGWSLTETFVGGRPRPDAREASPTGVSDFRGADPARWRTDVATYERLELGEVWPGITATVRARGRSVEKIFTLAPGAAVERLRVRVSGARALAVGADGALGARTDLGDVTFTPPVAYQERDGGRHEVAVTYWTDGREYGFAVGPYDRSRRLVIDPLLQSTYLGGGGEVSDGYAIALAPGSGDVYVVGGTASDVFPGTAGGAQPAYAGGFDAFVARLNGALTTLVQATYLGGADFDTAYTVAVAPATGDVYVAGDTRSTDLPGTVNGAQAIYGGGVSDTFIARLPASLTALTQVTYLGGADRDEAYGLAVGPSGHVYLTGYTRSTDFPGTGGGAQPTYAGVIDGFVARLNAGLTTLVQATYLGGSATDHASAIAIAPGTGDVYIAGDTTSTDFPATGGGAHPSNAGLADAFVARLPDTLTAMTVATYLGGAGDDVATSLAIAPGSGDVYVAGYTLSTDFAGTTGAAQPANAGGVDAFTARLDAALGSVTRVTYLGGGGDDYALSLGVDPTSGDVYAAGATTSTDFPHTGGSAQPAFGGGLYDGFVARLAGSLASWPQSTYLGGNADDGVFALAIDAGSGTVYAAGLTGSANFPATAGGAQSAFGGVEDAFVSRLTTDLLRNATFDDVPPSHAFFAWVEALFRSGITLGCSASPPLYCPDAAVTRGQMAVFILRGIHGAGYDPPPATGTMFADVATTTPFASSIEQFALEGITGGCAQNPPRYCPGDGVTRGQMAVFLLRAKHGAAYVPPPASGTMFGDVTTTTPFADWIEQLVHEGVSGGCSTSPPLFCPQGTVTRGQMAVFLVRTFNLPL